MTVFIGKNGNDCGIHCETLCVVIKKRPSDDWGTHGYSMKLSVKNRDLDYKVGFFMVGFFIPYQRMYVCVCSKYCI